MRAPYDRGASGSVPGEARGALQPRHGPRRHGFAREPALEVVGEGADARVAAVGLGGERGPEDEEHLAKIRAQAEAVTERLEHFRFRDGLAAL